MTPIRVVCDGELIPGATKFGFLVNPNNPNAESDTSNARRTADTLDRKIVVLEARNREDTDYAFTQLAQERADALLISADPLFSSSREYLVALAARHTLPAMFNSREFAFAGGLLSYGPDQADAYHEAGLYIGRILSGEKPRSTNCDVRYWPKADMTFCGAYVRL